MGNVDSIPVVSQMKSLFQVIAGDAIGAKATQEHFARQAPIASQVNSLVQSIEGNQEEARKIQEEFLDSSLTFAENLPVVGYAFSAGYAIAGDEEKARQIALGATKSTIILAAGAACGPGAPFCAAAAGLGTSVAWDGIESAIRHETTGILRGVERTVTGEASPGEVFDTGFAFGSAGLQGYFGGKVTGEIGDIGEIGDLGEVSDVGEVDGEAWRLKTLCKRSIMEEYPEEMLKGMPKSLKTLDVANFTKPGTQLSGPEGVETLINGIFGIFLVLNLMKNASPSSSRYFHEICHPLYPQHTISACEEKITSAIEKYDLLNEDIDEEHEWYWKQRIVEDSLNALDFQYKILTTNGSVLAEGIKLSICQGVFHDGSDQSRCLSSLSKTLLYLSNHTNSYHERVKRSPCGKKRRRVKYNELDSGFRETKYQKVYYGPAILSFLQDWDSMARYMAQERTTRFFSFLKKWDGDWMDEYPILRNRKIKGGTTKIQSARRGTNPRYNNPTSRPKYDKTEQSHFVEADIEGLPVSQWPPEVRRALGETYDVPSFWNQAVDRSFDHVQKKYIDLYNAGTPIDKNFVKNYLDDVYNQIRNDRYRQKFQYRHMDDRDIQSQLNRIDEMRNNDLILERIADDKIF